MIETQTEKMKRILSKNLKLGIIIFGYFTGPSPFRKDLSGSCAKAVAMNKVKDLTSLKTSKDYIQILVKNMVPDMTFEFIEQENTIMMMTDGLTREEHGTTKDLPHASNADESPEVQILEVKAMDKQTVSDDDIELEYERKMVQAATETEQKASYHTPIRQVHAGTSSVASSVTTRQSSAKKCDKGSISDRSALIEPKTVLVPTPVTPGQQSLTGNAEKSETGPTENVAANTNTAAILRNVSQPVLSQGGTLLHQGLFNLSTMPDTEETEVSSGINHQQDRVTIETGSHKFTGNEGEVPGKTSEERNNINNNTQDSRSESMTDPDDFTPVGRGAKVDSRNYAKKITTMPSENRNINSFAVLRDDDEKNTDDKAPDLITEDDTSINLLASQSKVPSQKKMIFDKIRSTIARTPQNTSTSPKKPSPVQSPTRKTPTKTKEKLVILGTFSHNDKKLREQKNRYE